MVILPHLSFACQPKQAGLWQRYPDSDHVVVGRMVDFQSIDQKVGPTYGKVRLEISNQLHKKPGLSDLADSVEFTLEDADLNYLSALAPSIEYIVPLFANSAQAYLAKNFFDQGNADEDLPSLHVFPCDGVPVVAVDSTYGTAVIHAFAGEWDVQEGLAYLDGMIAALQRNQILSGNLDLLRLENIQLDRELAKSRARVRDLEIQLQGLGISVEPQR